MTFNDIKFPGITATCKNCGVGTFFTGYQRYRLDEDNKVVLVPEYQCQDCGKLKLSLPDIPENKDILADRCECGGQFRRDKPIFCNSCLFNKTSMNQSEVK